MNSKVVKGCGIGCAALVLIFVAIAGSGMWYAKKMAREFDVVQEAETALVEAHGAPGTWTVPSGLVPTDEQVARFVQVRRETAEWRANLDRAVGDWLEMEQRSTNPLTRAFRTVQAATEAAPVYAGFWASRNHALLAAEMGPDEYVWLYHLVYHAWLGHDPASGMADADFSAATNFGLDRGEATGGQAVVDDLVRQRLRGTIVPLLEGAPDGLPEATAWRDDELARLADDSRRWPWQTDLPPAFAVAFAPHESALVAAWSSATNPMEMLFEMTSAPEADAGE